MSVCLEMAPRWVAMACEVRVILCECSPSKIMLVRVVPRRSPEDVCALVGEPVKRARSNLSRGARRGARGGLKFSSRRSFGEGVVRQEAAAVQEDSVGSSMVCSTSGRGETRPREGRERRGAGGSR